MKNFEQEVLQQVNESIAKSIAEKMTGYNSPLGKIVDNVITKHEGVIFDLVNGHVAASLSSIELRKELAEAVNKKIARLLIQRVEGELEKRVNALRADPIARARIDIAISEAVADLSKGGAA